VRILELELNNVKSYEHARIFFTEGVNAIVGQNGAGKSTLIEAVGYALFDALPYTAQEFVREGARSGSVAVTLLSRLDERPYRVERRFGSSTLYGVHDVELGQKLCEGKADVLAFVRRHLRVDLSVDLARLFTNALGVAQGTLTTAFSETPSNRKGIFDALLQVDDYNLAAERLREPWRRVEEQLKELALDLAVLDTRLEKLSALEQSLAHRSRELAQLHQLQATQERALQANQVQLQQLELHKRAVDSWRAQTGRQEEMVRGLSVQSERDRQACVEAEAAVATVAANRAGHDAYVAAQAAQEELQVRQQARNMLTKRQASLEKEIALAAARCQQLEQERADALAAEAAVVELASPVQRQESLERTAALLERTESRLTELERRQSVLADNQRQQAIRHAAVAQRYQEALAVEEQMTEVAEQERVLRGRQEQLRERVVRQRTVLAEVERQLVALAGIEAPLCPLCEQPLSAAHRSEVRARSLERQSVLALAADQDRVALAEQEQALAAAGQERQRLEAVWRRLPRLAEVTAAEQAAAEYSREAAELAAERQQLAGEVAGLAEVRTALAALGDPRTRRVLAAQKAARRVALEQELSAAVERLSTVRAQLQALGIELEAAGDLDLAQKQNAVALRQHAAAYQAVLSHHQLAERREQRCKLAEQSVELLRQAERDLAASRLSFDEALALFDQDTYQQVQTEERALRQQLGSLSASLSLLTRGQAEEEAQVNSLRAEQVRRGELVSERSRLTRQKEALEAVRTTIKQAGPHVTRALVQRVSEGAAVIFGELMGDHRRILGWGTDYGITLTTDGVERSFRQLSGGEQMSAALAVRLALVREMSTLTIAFFDEPTANLDSVRREALAQQILSVRGFTQLFVISHDDTFEEATQNLVRLVRQGNRTLVVDP
jgi:exonuclease SbcC